MDKREEYAIAVIILVALVVAVVSMLLSSDNLGLAAAGIAIIGVLYAIYVIHSDVSELELQQSYMQGYQDHATGKPMAKGKPAPSYGEVETPSYGAAYEEEPEEAEQDEVKPQRKPMRSTRISDDTEDEDADEAESDSDTEEEVSDEDQEEEPIPVTKKGPQRLKPAPKPRRRSPDDE